MYSLLLFNFLFYISIFIYNLFLLIYYTYTKFSDFLKSSYYYVFIHKTVYIIRGLPGSGKTSWCLNFLSNNNLKVSDNIIYCSCNNRRYYKYKYSYRLIRDQLDDSNKCLNNFINGIINKTHTILLDNNNLSKWEYINYKILAKKNGYKIKQICLTNNNILDINNIFYNRCALKPSIQDYKSMINDFEIDKDDIIINPNINKQQYNNIIL